MEAEITIYFFDNTESVTFDGITYTSETKLVVELGRVYDISIKPKEDHSFDRWHYYGVDFENVFEMSTTCSINVSEFANLIGYIN